MPEETTAADASPTPRVPTAGDHLVAGDAALETGDYRTAVTEYGLALRVVRNPAHAEGLPAPTPVPAPDILVSGA